MFDISRAILLFAFCAVTGDVGRAATPDHISTDAGCVDTQSSGTLAFEGTLTFHVFARSPALDASGGKAEPGFILKLEHAICIIGDAFLEAGTNVDRIQVITDPSDLPSQDLRRFVGLHVLVTAGGVVGAHTAHHHAPLLMRAAKITTSTSTVGSGGSTEADQSAMTTVQAFYLALAAGNGKEAAKLVVPSNRKSGPLSASRITSFYGRLVEPLSIQEVVPVRPHEYQVRYAFIDRGSGACEGRATVLTTKIGGVDFIASIKPIDGC